MNRSTAQWMGVTGGRFWMRRDVAKRLLLPEYLVGALLVLAVVVGTLAGASSDIAFGVATGPFVLAAIVYGLWRTIGHHPQAPLVRHIVAWGLGVRVACVAFHLVIAWVVYRGAVDFQSYLFLAQDLLTRVFMLDVRVLSADWLREQYILLSGVFVIALVAIIGGLAGLTATGSLLVCAGTSLVGSYLFLRAFEEWCPDLARREFVGRMLFMLPSIAYWSIFLGKDSTIFLFLGWMTYAVARLLNHFTIGGFVSLALSYAGVAFIRPHIGVPLGLACALALIVRPLRWEGPAAYLKPVQRLAVAVAIVVVYFQVASGALVWAGVQSLTLDAVSERVYQQHTGFAATQGGSRLNVVMTGATPADVAAFLPLGVFTLLFRPGLWDIHNPLAAMAAVENTWLMWVVVKRWRHVAGSIASLRRNPFMVFVVVALFMASIVLCFEWNLGAANRHRTMIMPFLVMLLAGPALGKRAEEAAVRPT
jgi:hypothetical protein